MRSKIVIALLISFFVLAITIISYRSGLFERAEDLAYDAKARLYRSAKTLPKNIKVILVDDASITALEKVAGRWPWPRAIWSDLLEYLSRAEAKMVLFDILFTERQDDLNDGAFAESTKDVGNVIHSMLVKREIAEKDQRSTVQLNMPLPEAFRTHHAMRNVQGALQTRPSDRNNEYLLPLEGLWTSARGVAVVEFSPDTDGVLRRTPPVREYQGAYFPVLGLAPFVEKSSKVIIGTKAIQINDRILPIDANGNYLINMYSIESVEPISVAGVLASLQMMREGEVENLVVEPAEFKDAIVFVGVSAIGGADLKATPLSTRTPGVMMHVSLAGNYLSQDFLMPPDKRLTYGAMVISVFLTASIVFLLKHFLIRASLPALYLIGYTFYSFYAFKMNMIVETVPFIFATVTSGFLSFGYLTFTEAVEKRRVAQLFTQYVSKDVLHEVLNNYEEYRKAAAGTSVELTVLFSDIRGFTTISETTPPEKIVEMLNIHFGIMADIILKHNGTIDKYIGDAIMAFWGAPVKTDDHAEKAVLAGKEMLKGLEKVNATLKQRGLHMEVKIGIGINSGVATIGEIGSEQKKNYTIVGDTVNLASRLESITKEYKCPLIISEYTQEQVQDKIPCTLLGNVTVKGRAKPVNIYTIT